MSLNWNDILEEQAKEVPDVAPEGSYVVSVESAEGVVAGTGAPMIKLRTKVFNGPYAGVTIFTNIVFSVSNAKAMRMTLRKLAALGVSQDWLAAGNPDQYEIARFINDAKPLVRAEVAVRQWNDEDRNDVKMFKPYDATADGAASAPQASAAPADATPPVPTVPKPDASAGGNAPDVPNPF